MIGAVDRRDRRDRTSRGRERAARPRPSRESSDLIRTAREIDAWPARHPLDFGESRDDTVRLGVVAPLAVLLDVLDDPPTVIVLDIRRF
jgi:hypothetical protein